MEPNRDEEERPVEVNPVLMWFLLVVWAMLIIWVLSVAGVDLSWLER
jgi:hypothetical protein